MSGFRSNKTQTKNGFALYMNPMFLALLFLRYFMCSFHEKISSNKTSRNFIVLTLLISWLFIFNVGRGEGMLYFLPDLWNNENLVFPTLSDSLFAEHHSLILNNSSLTVLNNVFLLLCSKTSVSIIGTSTFKELGRSLTYNKNNNSPSIGPCGTPHLISFSTVLAHSVILIYCFLPFK